MLGNLLIKIRTIDENFFDTIVKGKENREISLKRDGEVIYDIKKISNVLIRYFKDKVQK